MEVFDYNKEIESLIDKKWEILLTKGEAACNELWKPIDAKLNKLYAWKTHQLMSEGRQRELPFHRRKLE